MVYYILFAVAFFLSVIYFIRSMHIFQLNMYKSAKHLKWLGGNLIKLYFFYGAGKSKKPLVYTHRVIRMCVTAGVLFALIGAVIVWFELWLALILLLLLSPFFPIMVNAVNAPLEKINNNRYINDAKRIIAAHPNLITIGVTGSYGKTSTKFFLQKLLSVRFNTLMTPESYNTTMGVVKTVRNRLLPTHEVFVCEMGMMWKGDIAEICDIVNPKHAVITSIGHQHLATMKSIENITEEKFSITDSITDGRVFLNYDNGYIRDRKIDRNIIKYSVYESDTDYKATDISVSEKGTVFTVNAKNTQSGVCESVDFETALIGSHNVQNIVGAIAVAHEMGIPLNELVLPVKRLEGAPHRLQLLTHHQGMIIDDSFNSNPSGAKAALDVLKMFEGVRVLITPGMVELGEKSYDLNKVLGKQAADSCHYALLIGQRQAPPIKEGLLEGGFNPDRIHIFDSFDDGLKFANRIDPKGQKKVILIENDLPDNY